jgi:ABC-type uncharacterized transport system substrate-binding protein
MAVGIGRRTFISGLGGAATGWPFRALAQTSTLPKLGFMSQGPGPQPVPAFLAELQKRGWTAGKNIAMEWRFASWRLDRLAPLATELVRLKVNVIVTAATPAAKAAQSATREIPIVIVDPGDPVAEGLVASLAHPGGNITGQTSIAPDLASKRLELLKQAVPKISKVAVLWNSAIPPAEVAVKELRAAAAILKIDIQPVEVQGPQGFGDAFALIAQNHADALLVFPDPLTFESAKLIVGLANKNALPVLYGARPFVDAGGLISYGPSYADMWRRGADYANLILKGAKPADLPVEQPTKFDLVINLKTAKALGISMPPTLLAVADDVIE